MRLRLLIYIEADLATFRGRLEWHDPSDPGANSLRERPGM
jgi:hypothetical protein